jgi:hypothetical protein
MRTLFCCLIVVSSITLAPTSDDLRKMYGASTNVSPRHDGTPDSETFLLPPNLKLAVSYGADQQACILTIEPAPPSADQKNEKDVERFMSSIRISEILEQVAPANQRGEKPRDGSGGVFCAGSNGILSENYANLYIRHDIRCGEGPNSEKRVTVNFKREVCPKIEH